MSATLTPRVRIMVVCDEVIPSEIEDSVFTLEGVRQQRQAESLPCLCELTVFLLLKPTSRKLPGASADQE